MRSILATAAVVAIAAGLVPAQAATAVLVPAGTRVLLKFETPVDSSTIKEGTTVNFAVAANVLVSRHVIFREGTAARGVVTDVSKPGIFGKNARVHISYVEATAVDGRPTRLSPLDITPESLREVKDVSGAGATSLTGAILLGPIGLAAGALVRGGHVSVPVGAVGTASVAQDIEVMVP